ncbi:hypothetical protein GRF29_154g923709 [Pseudopithomyces chartarum]|uniref:C2H2-type domain-containing protein n=1 Tax=Pseudopithomyces chartarum TaxID=1892770 RepID=A0AAN6LRR6_9PLEO|nr:hypothetical protein GRF29_154g923709 [Pseudopithomyces chartarum]
MANRFALFAEDGEEPSPTVESTFQVNPFVNQVADNDAPWEKVKRGSKMSKPPPRTLVIRSKENKAPLTRFQPKSRDAPGPTFEANRMKAYDSYENWCGVCHTHLPNKNTLILHIKQSPQRHENYCNLCKRVFKDRNGLKNHVDHAAGHEIFCNLCLSAFINAWGLKNHFENNFSVAGHDFVCLTCLLGFRTRVELDSHLSTSQKHVCCNTCHRMFRDQTLRDEHWRVTTKHRHCLQPGCDFDAPNDNVLEKHLHDDHFQCEGCKHILPSQNKLNAHYESCKFAIACPNCASACAGQASIALHMESCFYCADCHFLTNHEGNYHIVTLPVSHFCNINTANPEQHMTKHATATIPCWCCDLPFRKCSSLINHLESGSCPNLPDPTKLVQCLGTFWYSTLYMDVDMHVQIRSKRINTQEMVQWMKEGLLQPFVCRAPGCGKTFHQFSSLLLHVESQACEWGVETLRLDLVQLEFKKWCERTA